MRLPPLRFTAGAFGKVAQLRLDNTQIALCQRREAAKAEASVKAFLSELAATNALNLSAVRQAQQFPEKRIQRETFVAKRQRVRNWLFVGHDHFSQIAA